MLTCAKCKKPITNMQDGYQLRKGYFSQDDFSVDFNPEQDTAYWHTDCLPDKCFT